MESNSMKHHYLGYLAARTRTPQEVADREGRRERKTGWNDKSNLINQHKTNYSDRIGSETSLFRAL